MLLLSHGCQPHLFPPPPTWLLFHHTKLTAFPKLHYFNASGPLYKLPLPSETMLVSLVFPSGKIPLSSRHPSGSLYYILHLTWHHQWFPRLMIHSSSGPHSTGTQLSEHLQRVLPVCVSEQRRPRLSRVCTLSPVPDTAWNTVEGTHMTEEQIKTGSNSACSWCLI